MPAGDIPPLSRSSRLSRLSKLGSRRSKDSKKSSNFNASDILPRDSKQPSPDSAKDNAVGKQNGDGVDGVDGVDGELVLGAPESDEGSDSPQRESESVNGQPEAEPQSHEQDDAEDEGSYDLNPPAPKQARSDIEAITSRFFSADHLDLILRNPNHAARLRRFLDEYMPQHASALTQYVESRKAFAAVEYANAIAGQIQRAPGSPPLLAASFDEAFGVNLREIAEALIEEALPAYLTNRLVSLVTESLVKDIVGKNAPFMKELVPNLAEVYCISDPSREDNPIIYASEEFFNMSQYGKAYVIGRNCRFLQGPETSRITVERLKDAITAGEETCEMILNYSRDGTPFVNLLLIAPLYDNKGDVRYFLGAQIDITSLIVGGRGLDSFAELIGEDSSDDQITHRNERDPLRSLGELGEMLSESESNFIAGKFKKEGVESRSGSIKKRPAARRVLSSNEGEQGSSAIEQTLWPDESFGHSGRLPGVYRNYLLVRPHPSLRITFTSPSLRIPGMLQTKFLDRIGGPKEVREGLIDALSNGTSVTAKISWLTNPSSNGDNKYVGGSEGKPRWIHCTPMLGSDEKVGVWMVVIVEEEEVTGMLNRQDSTKSSRSATPLKRDVVRTTPNNELYSDYLRGNNDGRPQTGHSHRTTSSTRERREVDDQFRDF